MAEFFSNYSGAQPQRTSLADMMNMASGVQNYQQAQQMNPLALRKAAAETMVSEQTAPTRVAEQQAQTETAQAGANSAKLKNILDHVSNIKRESVKLLSEKSLTREDVIKHYKDTLESAGGDEKALAQAIRKIPQTNDTNELKKWIARDFTGALTAESQIEKLFPKAEMQSIGGSVRPTYGGSALSFTTPGTQAGPSFATNIQPQIVEVAGVKYFAQPSSTPNGQPTLTPVGNASTNAPAVTNQPVQGQVAASNVVGQSGAKKLVMQDMPVQAGGITQLNDYQKPRYESGMKLIQESVNAATAATEGEETSRQIKKSIGAASGSAPGQFLRKAGQWVSGDPELETLAKNIADQQLRNMQIMGVKTDAASSDVKSAGAKTDLTKEALRGIVDRTDASNTAVKAFQKGLKNYSDKEKINGVIHSDKFQQSWGDNYDVRIFKAMNIDRSNMSKAQKDLERQKLIKGLSDAQLEELSRKAANIEQLERGDR